MKLDGWHYDVRPGLIAGRYPMPQELPVLLDKGVTLFLDLTEEGELPPYAPQLPPGVQHLRMPVKDFSTPTPETMVKILSTLETALAADRKIYLHCHGGIGRTGTVVGCHLVERGLSGKEALLELRHLRLHGACNPHSPETVAQFAMVRQWRPSLLRTGDR